LILLISIAGSAHGSVQVEKTLLYKLTPEQSATLKTDSLDKVFTFSSDGLHFFFRAPGKVTFDGVESEKYDAVYGARFSPDGKHTAYVAWRNHKYSVVIDGRKSPEYDLMDVYVQKRDSPQTIIYTPDSRHYAYLAREGKVWFAVVDGQRRPGDVEALIAAQLVLTPDGKHTAFVAYNGAEQKVVVVDGQVQPYSNFDELVVSSDGKRWAYKTRQANGKWLVVTDGAAGPEYDDILAGSLSFPDDGKYILYTAKLADRWSVVINGQPTAEQSGNRLLSQGEKPIAYRESDKGDKTKTKDDKEWVVLNGIRGPTFNSAYFLVFSPDGSRLAYKGVRKKDKECIVVDGLPGPDYESVTEPVFSGDGKHVAYSALSKKKWMTVIDGVPGPKFDDIGFSVLGITIANWFEHCSPALSYDGSRVAYGVMQKNSNHVWVDGVLGPQLGRLLCKPIFSADGKHVAYLASTAKDGMFAVLNGQAGPGLESIVPSYDSRIYPNTYKLGFDAGNSIEYLARTGLGSPEGDAIYRIKLTPAQ
jgi:hypothetical protein